jgi:hypothetical protein
MTIPDDVLENIEQKLREIAELDPAEVPEPAAQLAELLGQVLDEVDNP